MGEMAEIFSLRFFCPAESFFSFIFLSRRKGGNGGNFFLFDIFVPQKVFFLLFFCPAEMGEMAEIFFSSIFLSRRKFFFFYFFVPQKWRKWQKFFFSLRFFMSRRKGGNGRNFFFLFDIFFRAKRDVFSSIFFCSAERGEMAEIFLFFEMYFLKTSILL